MLEWFEWILQPEQRRTLLLLLLLPTFCGIVVYLYCHRGRGQRLEACRYIPFADDDESERTHGYQRVKDND